MKKIMFNDRYGLTQAVLEGKKTMTRREVKLPNGMIHRDIWNPVMSIDEVYFTFGCIDSKQRDIYPLYRIGEEVAIAQPYKQCWDIYQKQWESYNDPSNWRTPDAILGDSVQETAGWTNKMFVKAEYMPHRIRITDVRIERMNDIPDDDFRREGIIHVEWKQWLKQNIDDLSPQRYKTHDLWTLPKFEEEWLDSWAEQSPDNITASDPRTCFIVLFAKLAKKQPKDMIALNPWVFAYEFELIK